MLPHEAQRLAAEHIRHIGSLVLLRAFIAAKQRRHAVALVRVVVYPVVAVPVEEIEAALERQEAFCLPHVPFADATRRVTGLLEHVANRHLAHIQPERHLRRHRILLRRVQMAEVHHVVAHHVIQSVALRITPRQHTPARRRAGRPRHIKTRPPHAFGGQLVQMRRDQRLATDAPEVRIALIIADDEDDVWLGGKACADQQQEGGKTNPRACITRAHRIPSASR